MKQRSHPVARTASPSHFMGEERERQSAEFLRSAEWGRKAILAGWVAATLGIVGYVWTLIRAGEQTGVLEAMRNAGPIAWLSAFLLAGGVAIWLAGNIALMRALIESEPGEDEQPPQL